MVTHGRILVTHATAHESRPNLATAHDFRMLNRGMLEMSRAMARTSRSAFETSVGQMRGNRNKSVCDKMNLGGRDSSLRRGIDRVAQHAQEFLSFFMNR